MTHLLMRKLAGVRNMSVAIENNKANLLLNPTITTQKEENNV